MKVITPFSADDNAGFMGYKVSLNGFIHSDGRFEVEEIESDPKINQEEILKVLKQNRFKTDFIPKELKKIYIRHHVLNYRNPNDSLSKIEAIEFYERQKERYELERERNSTLDTINNVYIPKDLKDCFLKLDEMLSKIDKERIKKLGTGDLHFSLGLWIRNNWLLCGGGSRLEKYFRDRSPYNIQTDTISSDILDNYYKWLNGNINIAEQWEKENPVVRVSD